MNRRDPNCTIATPIAQHVDAAKSAHAYRVQMHIPAQGKPPFFPAEQHRFEAPLEQVSAPAMPTIEPNAVAEIQPLRRPTQIGLSQFEDQMIMIVHQDIAMQSDVETIHHFGQVSACGSNQPAVCGFGSPTRIHVTRISIFIILSNGLYERMMKIEMLVEENTYAELGG